MISPDCKSIDTLVAGARGSLGRTLVDRLVKRGLKVRAMVRTPLESGDGLATSAEIVVADARDPAAVERAVTGVRQVVSALTGFARGGGTEAVDRDGNLNLVASAERQGVERFVLTSIVGAAPDHPLDVNRMKHAVERRLESSRLAWTVLRPTVLMETWVSLIGGAVEAGAVVPIVGRGDNPVNFVSARDVAAFAELALTSDRLIHEVVEIGGPEDLTLGQVVALFERASGRQARVRRLPVGVARGVRTLLRPLLPTPARFLDAALAMDTADMRFDAGPLQTRFPDLALTTFAGLVGEAGFEPTTT